MLRFSREKNVHNHSNIRVFRTIMVELLVMKNTQITLYIAERQKTIDARIDVLIPPIH